MYILITLSVFFTKILSLKLSKYFVSDFDFILDFIGLLATKNETYQREQFISAAQDFSLLQPTTSYEVHELIDIDNICDLVPEATESLLALISSSLLKSNNGEWNIPTPSVLLLKDTKRDPVTSNSVKLVDPGHDQLLLLNLIFGKFRKLNLNVFLLNSLEYSSIFTVVLLHDESYGRFYKLKIFSNLI